MRRSKDGAVPADQVWKRLDGQVVKAFHVLRLDLQRYLQPLATAIEDHLAELRSWAVMRCVRALCPGVHPTLTRPLMPTFPVAKLSIALLGRFSQPTPAMASWDCSRP